MENTEQLHGSGSARAVEDGETYTHAEHGRVEITGIWQRTQRLDTACYMDGQEMIVIRYLPAEDGNWMDERAEPLDDFLEAIG